MYPTTSPVLFNLELQTGVRTPNGAVCVKTRLAVALRILAGGSYLDASAMFGIAPNTVYHILWEVVDAINATPEVGPFFFPQTVSECEQHAARFKVCDPLHDALYVLVKI